MNQLLRDSGKYIYILIEDKKNYKKTGPLCIIDWNVVIWLSKRHELIFLFTHNKADFLKLLQSLGYFSL